MYKIVEFTHHIIKDYLLSHKDKYLYVLDATCGAGNDTMFIANNITKGEIDAYDIQLDAILQTKELLKDCKCIVNYHHESHEFIKSNHYDLALFNLGYLPKGDKSITTTKDTTMKALNILVNDIISNDKLLIVIAIYVGHSEGALESVAINDYVKALDSKKYLVTKFENYNRPLSPYVITISKNQLK